MKIFFIGIGGISMSGLATICKNLGYEVYGSDRDNSEITKKLIDNGINVYIGHDENNIKDDIDLVVHTAAVKKDNVEMKKAFELGIKIQERAVFLGQLMKKYENSIAIAGTHGKTTTTSITTLIFNKADKNPTALIGGVFANIGGNIEIGNSDVFITEACEYVDSFLQFLPKIAIITNVESDHLDYFKDLKQIQNSFFKFANGVKANGFIVANGDDKNVLESLKNCDKKIYYVGFDDKNDFIIKNFTEDDNGLPEFDIYYKGNIAGHYKLNVFGRYNVYNCSYAIVTAYLCNINNDKIQKALDEFVGVGRRFELVGEKDKVKVYDDYAHHPTEIKSTLGAAKMLKKNRLISIFQPHTYTRTKSLYDDFVKSFDDSDVVIFADIYAAREPFDEIISSKMLCEDVKKRNKECYYFDSFEKISDFLKDFCKKEDVIFTIGAGDIYKVGRMYLN